MSDAGPVPCTKVSAMLVECAALFFAIYCKVRVRCAALGVAACACTLTVERKARRCSVVVGQHGGWRRVAMLAALESGVGQVRSGRYHRLCAPPSTDFHFPSVTPPRSGSGWRHQPPSLRRFPILNVKRKTSSEFRVHSAVFDHTTLQRCSLCD